MIAKLRAIGATRLILGSIGVFVLAYGAARILQDNKHTNPRHLAEWMIAAGVIHDGIVAPLTVAIGWLTQRLIPHRARAFVQSGLAMAAMVTVVAIPLIKRDKHSGAGSALLKQNYRLNLVILWAVIAVLVTLAYALRVSRQRSNSTNVRPPADQVS